MEILDQLAIALGFATLAGLNLYLTVFVTGIAIKAGWITLATQYQGLEVLGSEWVIIASGIFAAAEFFADKVPWVDSAWDAVHTVIRPIGGGLLAMKSLGTVDPGFDVIVAMLAGGATFVTHGVKAGTRLVVNASPEPFSNAAVSVVENGLVLGGLGLMSWSPKVAGLVFLTSLCLSLWLLPKMWRRLRGFLSLIMKKLGSPFLREETPRLYTTLGAEATQALAASLGERPEVLWSAQALTGGVKGFAGLKPYCKTQIVALGGERPAIHLVWRRWGTRHLALELSSLEIGVESRFLSEDVVLFDLAGTRRLALRFPATQRRLAESVAEGLMQGRRGRSVPRQVPVKLPHHTAVKPAASAV